jgi:hypothetical protein
MERNGANMTIGSSSFRLGIQINVKNYTYDYNHLAAKTFHTIFAARMIKTKHTKRTKKQFLKREAV